MANTLIPAAILEINGRSAPVHVTGFGTEIGQTTGGKLRSEGVIGHPDGVPTCDLRDQDHRVSFRRR